MQACRSCDRNEFNRHPLRHLPTSLPDAVFTGPQTAGDFVATEKRKQHAPIWVSCQIPILLASCLARANPATFKKLDIAPVIANAHVLIFSLQDNLFGFINLSH